METVMKKLFVIFQGLLLLFAGHTPAHAQARLYAVQLASVSSETEAHTMIAALATAGVQAYLVKASVPGQGLRYRVRFGRFTNQADAKAQAEQALRRQTIQEYIVTF